VPINPSHLRDLCGIHSVIYGDNTDVVWCLTLYSKFPVAKKESRCSKLNLCTLLVTGVASRLCSKPHLAECFGLKMFYYNITIHDYTNIYMLSIPQHRNFRITDAISELHDVCIRTPRNIIQTHLHSSVASRRLSLLEKPCRQPTVRLLGSVHRAAKLPPRTHSSSSHRVLQAC
jgi:hypothetical protein